MARPVEMTLEQAIDRVGPGRFQRKLPVVAGASWAADAMEVLLIAFAIPSRATGMGRCDGPRGRHPGPDVGATLLTVSLPLALTVYAATYIVAGLLSLAGRETREEALADTLADMAVPTLIRGPLVPER